MSKAIEQPGTDLRNAISELLLAPAETIKMRSHGSVVAAVLIPLYVEQDKIVAVFTKRHSELRRHAGEIAFPGGRRDTGEDLRQTALREAEEEIGLNRETVELVGALPPTSTFVTNYSVYPFVGMIEPGAEYVLSPREVERVVEFPLGELVASYERKRLIRLGVPVKTDSYTVGDNLIWGATARILTVLLERLDPLVERPVSDDEFEPDDPEAEATGEDG